MATTGRVVVVGLGPAGPELTPSGARACATGAARRFVRTLWHPAAKSLAQACAGVESFDEVYEKAESFEEVYETIVESLVSAAVGLGEGYVFYGVPGSPLVAERSVRMLLADGRVEVDMVPALSFLDLAWQRLGIDPLDEGVRLVDGSRFGVEAAGERGPLLVAQCWSKEILSEMKLAATDGPGSGSGAPGRVTVLQRLGCPDESVFEIDWDGLDREVVPDHMTSVYVPSLAAPVAMEVARLEELVRILRERCPWDRKQTHRSLTKHLVEEAYEVLDAIAALPGGGDVTTALEGEGDLTATVDGAVDRAYADLEEELGDLLFQVLFHSRLAAEQGRFGLADVAATTYSKLVGRHPHVFGEVVAETPEAVMSNWEQIKKREKGRSSIMEGIPSSLPALGFAYKVQKKAASVGFDWEDPTGPLAKLGEEAGELAEAVEAHGSASSEALAELGDLLFSIVNVARHLGLDPELALRQSASGFLRRFGNMEALAEASGFHLPELSLAAMDELWEEVKRSERET